MSQPPNSPGRIKDVLTLTKVPITAAVTLTTATGWFLAGGQAKWLILFPVGGVFFLAGGS